MAIWGLVQSKARGSGVFRLAMVTVDNPSVEDAVEILSWLEHHRAEILVIHGINTKSGSFRILDALTRAGYHFHFGDFDYSIGGTLIVTPWKPRRNTFIRNFGPHAAQIRCKVDGHYTDILAVNVPRTEPWQQRDPQHLAHKRQFLEDLTGYCDSLAVRPLIVLGSLKADLRHPPSSPELWEMEDDLFDQLREIGLVDLSNAFHTGEWRYSYEDQDGTQLRWDYVYASEKLLGKAREHTYHHQAREKDIFPHSPLTVELETTVQVAQPRDPLLRDDGQTSLF